MKAEKSRLITSIIKYTAIGLIVMLYGFFVLSRSFIPQKSDDLLQTNYTDHIQHEVEHFQEDMLMINNLIVDTFEMKDDVQISQALTTFRNFNHMIKNIHVISSQRIQIYDNEKMTATYVNSEDWMDRATVNGHISAPYLDPISMKDIISISYKIETSNDVDIITYDVSIDDIIVYFSNITEKTFLLSFNDGQRLYDTNGIVTDTTISEATNAIPFKLLDESYQLIYLSEDPYETIYAVLSGIPIVLLTVSIILGFLTYVITHFYNAIDRFFEQIDIVEKQSSFTDLKMIKTLFHQVKFKLKEMERERAVLEKIQYTEWVEVQENRDMLAELGVQIEKCRDEIASNHRQLTAISNVTPSLVWIADSEDRITFVNTQLRQHLIEAGAQTIKLSDLLMDIDTGSRLLKKRDYNKIKLKLKQVNGGEALLGKTKRIFFNNTLQAILFATNTSNFDSKMHYNYLRKSRDLHFINEVTKIINNNVSMDQTLQEVMDKVAFLGNFNACTIRLMSDTQTLDKTAAAGYSVEHLYEDNLPFHGTHMGVAYAENRMIVINTENDMEFEEMQIAQILNNGRSIVYLPLSNFDKSFGVMAIISDLPFNSDILVMLESIAINVTISLEKLVLYDQLKANYFKTVEAFVNATEIKSDRFSGHSRRVAEICNAIAERLFLSKTEAEEIFIAGLLHDVGKLAFQDDSLEYFNDVEVHGEIGMKMVENVGLSKEILEGIAYHHMNFDWKHQDDEKMHEQPYYAQIIRIANDFDVFVYKHKNPFEFEGFFEHCKAMSGSVYAPQIFNVLKDIVFNQSEKIERIYQTS
ncbi:HD domain-containing protein [Fusibacter paucivorans]|uniref:HD domain-containing protein n=1 Tax=Fusibacter paucivorans TaxID=76009 RepID=A0ABS5PNB4_9FIRM|nr:HD domain-containing protein [Fusibacter paucivorans]MBS7526541.1 HD domain-containing protein [Fusibacter paucivorans]